ncbi:DUF4013 domain-containing protein [uncultured Methanospirillum sp.]|uniref:DUF4013 domain-containing protein n=1 Tax=uncultured Methanospirillum sp. TaxID=262503 RepID=UPI0029C833AE|nr:DUF4013 domain-containing protein [uncultured Methanospirillum sp.]
MINVGEKSLIHKYVPELKIGFPILLPPPFNQCALHIVIVLIFVGIILMIVQAGYITRIYRGLSPAPQVRDWKNLFRDGFSFSVIGLVYNIIPMLIAIFTVILPLYRTIKQFNHVSSTPHPLVLSPELLQSIGIAIGGLLLSVLLFIVFNIFGIIGLIRFSRSGSIRSAFEISEILKKIGNIGWIRYLLSLLVLLFVVFLFSVASTIIALVLTLIGFIAGFLIPGAQEIKIGIQIIITFFFDVLIMVFNARYLTVLYDNGTEPIQKPTICSGESEF